MQWVLAWNRPLQRWEWGPKIKRRLTTTRMLARCLLLSTAPRDRARLCDRAPDAVRILHRLVSAGHGDVAGRIFSCFKGEERMWFYGLTYDKVKAMAGCRRSYLSDYSESEYDSEPASDEDDDAMERAADRFEAAFAVHTAEAHGGDAAATTRTAAIARHLHDECNRAVDKVWSKPNKKGDLCCIFEDSSDDETVAAR